MESKEKNQLHPLLTFGWVFNKGYERICANARKEFGLTQNEADVLLFLTNNKGFNTAMDIVRYRCSSKALVSRSIDSLTARGFLTTRTDPDDRRFTRLYVTPEAQEAVAVLTQAQHEYFQMLSEEITAQEQETLTAVLQKFSAKIDQYLKE